MRRFMAAVVLCAALGACTTPTVFGPATRAGGVGYTEQRIEPGRYRVTFRGGSGASAAQISDYALLRAAQLTLADGYDWFQVVDRYMAEVGASSGPQFSLGMGGGSGGGYYDQSAVGVGVGTSFNLGGGPAIHQTLEVLMGKDPRPAGPAYYDARQVRNSIAPPS